MRILHIITDTDLGGSQQVCIELCKSAVKKGYEIGVCSMTGGPMWEALPKEVSKFELKHIVKPVSFKHDLLCLFELYKTIRKFKPQIIQLHCSKASVLGRIVNIFTRCKIIYTVHGFDIVRLKHKIFVPLMQILQHVTDATVAVSKYDYNALEECNIRKRIHYIYNGVTLPSDKPNDELEKMTGEKIVMTLARLTEQKDYKMFVDVAQNFDNSWKFVWIGGTYEKAKELITDREIPSNVVFLGELPNASCYLHYANVFVLFSKFEGLPMSIIEAMSKGKFVIASNVGGIPELIDDKVGSLVSSVEDATRMLKKHTPQSKNEFNSDSYNKFENLFTTEKMWEEYDKLYKKLLNS